MEKENNSIVSINKELNIEKYEAENIKNLIYNIKGKQVMLDSDVAMLYHYETKYINLAVRRNQERFPESFCFQLTKEEFDNLRLQIATLNYQTNNKSNVTRKYLPYVFTEQGIAMLSGILKNEIAIQVSINIINAFVEMRNFIALNGQVFQEINTIKGKLLEHDKKFDRVFDELQNKQESEFKQKIFFDGQIYDAYSLIIDIIKSAKTKILIIDNYIDESILKILAKKNRNVEVVILTSQNCDLSKLDVNKFNKQYPVLKVARTNRFHDRFIVIDNKELYHCGASLKDLGKKCFAISKMEDMEYVKRFEQIVNNQ
ncbi:MAG: ORF6N domain-containing protein [Clostridia bacterium]